MPYYPATLLFFKILAGVISAFAIWLTVRIVNRRERWAKRSAIALAVVLVLYPLSFGPACWIANRWGNKSFATAVDVTYHPIFLMWAISAGNSRVRHVIGWYMNLGYPQPEGD